MLEKHHIHPLRHMSHAGESKSKLLALYKGIAKDKFLSDEAEMASLYPTKNAGSSYRKLKSDLREKLIDTVLRIDTDLKHYTDYQRAYYRCHKQWLTVRFLTGQNANTAAITLGLSIAYLCPAFGSERQHGCHHAGQSGAAAGRKV